MIKPIFFPVYSYQNCPRMLKPEAALVLGPSAALPWLAYALHAHRFETDCGISEAAVLLQWTRRVKKISECSTRGDILNNQREINSINWYLLSMYQVTDAVLGIWSTV